MRSISAIHLAGGRQAGDPRTPDRSRSGVRTGSGPRIELRDVHSAWASGGGVASAGERAEALSGLSLILPAGQITVLLGDHRSGKTLVTLHLLGEVAPDRGQVLVDGRSLWELPEPQRVEMHDSFGVLRGGTAIRESKIDIAATVRANLTAQLRHARTSADPEGVVGEWLAHYDLTPDAESLPQMLDSGARRRLAVALALAGDPAVVVIDDPGQAMDSDHLRHMVTSVREWQARTGSTVLLTVHSLQVALDLGHQVAVLSEGQVLAHGHPEDVLSGVNDDDTFQRRFGTGLGGVAEADPLRLTHLHTDQARQVHGWGRSYLNISHPMSRHDGFTK